MKTITAIVALMIVGLFVQGYTIAGWGGVATSFVMLFLVMEFCQLLSWIEGNLP